MNSLEGTGQLIEMSSYRENRQRSQLAPVTVLPTALTELAPVVVLPTALKEPLEALDDIVETMVRTGDLSTTISLELARNGQKEKGKELLNDCTELRQVGFDEADIEVYVIDFLGPLDSDLQQKALLAIEINRARLNTVDFEEFAALRDQA